MEDNKKLEELSRVLKDWTQTSLGRRHFLQSLPLLLAACASTGQHRYREGDNKGQAVSLSPADERRMAQQVLPKMQQQYPVIRDPELQSYISNLGNRIVASNSLNGAPYNYSFQMVQSPQVNAFALPAGPVFVTAPLLTMCDSEAELAGVLGHEVGHIKARHTAERIHRMENSKGKSIAYLLGGGLLGGLLGYGLGKLMCSRRDRSCQSRAIQLGAGVGAGGSVILSKFAFMAHSREDELEADRVGFRTSVKAGFDKNRVGDFYEKLLLLESQSKSRGGGINAFSDALSTHPPSQQRVVQMKEMARSTGGFQSGRVSSPTFERMKARAERYAKG